MITLYWFCPICGETGSILIKFAQATPCVLDDEASELKAAEELARNQIKHEHKINFVRF